MAFSTPLSADINVIRHQIRNLLIVREGAQDAGVLRDVSEDLEILYLRESFLLDYAKDHPADMAAILATLATES